MLRQHRYIYIYTSEQADSNVKATQVYIYIYTSEQADSNVKARQVYLYLYLRTGR